MNLLKINSMILIGATSRNIGKTSLAVELIKELALVYNVIGLKVTTIQPRHKKCPRGGKGCGVCTSLQGNYDIVQEKDKTKNKDTSKLLCAGAKKVYWIRVFDDYVTEAIHEFCKMIPNNTVIICESNSIRKYVLPGLFIMLDTENQESQKKKSALDVIDKANVVLTYNHNALLRHYEPHPAVIDKVFQLIEKIKNTEFSDEDIT